MGDDQICVTPSPVLILYLVPTFVQCSLLYPGLRPQSLARSLRLLLLPINLWACYSIAFRFCWTPLGDASGSNLLLTTLAVHCTFRSIEWAANDQPYFTRPAAWPDPLASEPKKDADENRAPLKAPHPLRLWSWFTWSLLTFSSLRGIHFTWGLRQSQPWNELPSPTTLDLLLRLLTIHLAFLPASAYSILDRDHGIGWWSPNFSLPATMLSNLAFGVTIMCSMEIYYTTVALLARLFHALPLNSRTWSAYWAPQAFTPMLFQKPHLSRSMAEFWGRGWHTLFRRPFLVVAKLLAWPSDALGILRGQNRRILNLFLIFFCSGLYHDAAIWGISHSPLHPNPYQLSISSFPHSSMAYFLAQPFAILLEPLFLPYLSPFFRTVWVWTFTLFSVTGFRQAFFGKGRMISGPKPVEEWGLLEALVPGYILSQF